MLDFRRHVVPAFCGRSLAFLRHPKSGHAARARSKLTLPITRHDVNTSCFAQSRTRPLCRPYGVADFSVWNSYGLFCTYTAAVRRSQPRKILFHAQVWSWQRAFKPKKAHRHIPSCRASCCFWRPDCSSKSASRPSSFIMCIERGARPSFLLRRRRRQDLLNVCDHGFLFGIELPRGIEFLQ